MIKLYYKRKLGFKLEANKHILFKYNFFQEVVIMLKMLNGQEKRVDEFRQTYKCKTELSLLNPDTVLYLMTTHVYNHDAQWLTLRKTRHDAKIDQKQKQIVIKWLKDEIDKYLNGNVVNQADFDNWHKMLCQELTDRINNEVLLGYKPIHMGKAQKIINMTFKLLSSLDDTDDFEQKFELCHVPLDSNILEWYYSNIAKDVKKSRRKVWSNLEYEDYIKIQEDIRSYCSNTEYVPLAFEWRIF